MTDPRGVCAERAENLELDVSYVRGWQKARRGTSALAEQLRALGLEAEFPGLKADVNVDGDGVVCVGTVRPNAVRLLVLNLVSGLTVEMAERAAPASGGEDAPTTPAA